jgi:tetratricopeptide (TPR) repeat protein
MKHTERRHLKENELARALGRLNVWSGRHRSLLVVIGSVAVVGGLALLGYTTWRTRVDTQARALLAEAMVVYEAPVEPPRPGTDPAQATTPQAPRSFPSERARLEAALPKFLAAADGYPRTEAGRMARYHAASVLVELGRYDEAIAQYDRVNADDRGILGQMSRLGKAEAQLRAGQYEAAIAAFKELADRRDLPVPPGAMLLELARAYRVAGRTDDARKTLTQIVEQHADTPFAVEAREELEKLQG